MKNDERASKCGKAIIFRDDRRYCFFTADLTLEAHIHSFNVCARPYHGSFTNHENYVVSGYTVRTQKFISIGKEPGMVQSMDFESSVGTWGPGGGA